MRQKWCLLSVLFVLCASGAAAQTYEVTAHVIAAGVPVSSTAGLYSLVGTAGQADAAGDITAAPYSIAGGFWTAAAEGVAPRITRQPRSGKILADQSVTLDVAVAGTAPLLYQWYAGDSPNPSGPIAGAIDATYGTPPLSSARSYWVRIANRYGPPANSDTAVIAIGSPFADVQLSVIRAIHLLELRARTSALRDRFGLPVYPWSDAAIQSGMTVVHSRHILEVRAALSQVYAAAGLAAPVFAGAIVPGASVARATHILELRAAVVALE